MIREDTLVDGSKLVLKKNNDKVYFYEDEEWWFTLDLSTNTQDGDTIEYYIPKNANIFTPDTFNTINQINYRGPFYNKLILGDSIFLEDGSKLNTFYTEDITYNLNPSASSYRYLHTLIQKIGSNLSLFGEYGISVDENYCRAGLGCFKNKYFDYEFFEGVCTISSMKKEESNTSIKVFPNPTKNWIYFGDQFYNKIEVVNKHGTCVTKALAANQVDLSNLNPGVYILLFFNEKSNIIGQKRIVKL